MPPTTAFPEVKFWRDEDLPGVEIRYSRYTTVAFPRHTHDCYSVGIVEAGTSSVFLRGQTRPMGAGDIAVMQPGEVHACNPLADTGWTYRMFHIDAGVLEDAALEVFGKAMPEPWFPEPLLQDRALYDALAALHRAVSQGALALEKQSLLLEACELLLQQADAGSPLQQGDEPRAVTQVREHLQANASRTVSLAELAELTGLSRYAVLRSFQRSAGLSPHSFQTQLRIAMAKKLLRQGADIAQAALSAGYTDQSHFSNAFKQVTGATPRQYQHSV